MILNRSLGHGPEESRFLILLVQQARAGTRDLKDFFQKQIDEQKAQRLLIRERFKTGERLNSEDQMRYYSDWYFAAIHVLVSIPEFQNPEGLSKTLRLPLSTVNESLEFLKDCGLVKIENGRLGVGKSRIHLGSDSPLINKHHLNWRLRGMQSLERRQDRDIHYTSVVSLSAKDVERLREMWIEVMEKFNSTVAASPEEECHCLCLDVFRVDDSNGG